MPKNLGRLLLTAATFGFCAAAQAQSGLSVEPDTLIPVDGTHIVAQTPEAQQGLEDFLRRRALGIRPRVQKGAEPIGTEKTFKSYNFKKSQYENIVFELKDTDSGTPAKYKIWVEKAELDNNRISDGFVTSIATAMGAETPTGSYNSAAGIIENMETIFGVPPDVDEDGTTDVLLLDIRDNYVPRENPYFIGGYVDSADLSESGNNADIIYLDTYPASILGSTYVAAVGAHEYQHLIMYNYDLYEYTFINEGLSEFAELALGYSGRVIDYLSSSSKYNSSLYSWGGGNVIDDYKRAGHFMSYWGNQFGVLNTGSITRIPQQGSTGLRQTLAGTGATLEKVIFDFHVANYVNDTSLGPHYGYPTYGGISAAAVPQITVEADSPSPSNSTTISIAPGATTYIQWTNANGFELRLESGAGQARGALVRQDNLGATKGVVAVPSDGSSVFLNGLQEKVVLVLADTNPLGSGSTVTFVTSWGNSLVFSETVRDQTYTEGGVIPELVLPAATGGKPPYDYALTPGLPQGLTFDPSTRIVSGTPTSITGRTSYVYSATDAAANTANIRFSIEIIRSGLALVETVEDLTITTADDVSGLMLPAATGGTPPYTYSLSPDLPAGLSFDASARTINGTPEQATARTLYTYTVTDASSVERALEFYLEILTAFTIAGTVTDQEFIVEIPIQPVVLPGADGGVAPYSYSLSPDLPTGLSFDASTRTIDGTPESITSETEYTYTASDAESREESLQFSIAVVAPALTLMGTVEDQTFRQGVTITAVVLPGAAKGVHPFKYSVEPELPAGLSFDTDTRTLKGTPATYIKPTPYRYVVMDAISQSVEQDFNIEIIAAPPLFWGTIQDQVLNRGVAVDGLILPPAVGGDHPNTLSLEPDLPEGLTFSTITRRITGTPLFVTDPKQYTYTVTDELARSDTLLFQMEVISPVSAEDSDELPAAFEVRGNYPNPFSSSTSIVMDLPEPADLSLTFTDVLGRVVQKLGPVRIGAGSNRSVAVDGQSWPAGVYIYRLVARTASDDIVRTGTIMRLK